MINKRVFRIVLASPGDVLPECDVVEKVVKELNKSIAMVWGLHLELDRWQTDAQPEFDHHDRQAAIDRALRIEEADLFIAIFWKRFGTPVKGAKSGTEHEFRLAHEALKKNGKPQILVYFNEAPCAVKSKSEVAQLAAVIEFKDNFPQEGMYWPYEGLAAFERDVRTHLTRRICGLNPLEERGAYVEQYARLVSLAKTELILYHSKLHRTQDRPEARLINDALRSARSRDIRVRILLADGYDRLPAALELQNEIGAEVRFDPEIHRTDLNYVCADNRYAILATRSPSDPSRKYVPSTSSVELDSGLLVSSLWMEFNRRWDSLTTRTINLQMREVLPKEIEKAGPDAVRQQLGVSIEVVERYRHPKAFVIFLIGRPGSGKSTVARQIVKQAPSAEILGRRTHVSDLEYLRKTFTASSDEHVRFRRTEDGGFFITDSTLYREALEYLTERASNLALTSDLLVVEFARTLYVDALGTLSICGLKPDLVVYLNVTLETALRRNKERVLSEQGDKHFVSEREMRETYAKDDIEELVKVHQGPMLIVNNENEEASVGRDMANEIMRRMREML